MATQSMTMLAVAVLMVTTASAETPSPPSDQNGAKIAMVTTQSSDQWLASEVIGSTVYSSKNQKVGSVADLLLDNKGMPVAAVIQLGGFLGMGGKKVTIDLKSMQFVRSSEGDRVIAPVSEEQLKVAADFTPYSPPPPAAPVSTSRPMGSPSPLGVPGPSRP
jgi:sporulation protein YlmC with PRC-barrel domain